MSHAYLSIGAYGGGVVLMASGWSFGHVLKTVTVRRLRVSGIGGAGAAGLTWVRGWTR
jgi:hypothetical protein